MLDIIGTSYADDNTISDSNDHPDAEETPSNDRAARLKTLLGSTGEACTAVVDIKAILQAAEDAYYDCAPFSSHDVSDKEWKASNRLGSLLRVAIRHISLLSKELEDIDSTVDRIERTAHRSGV